MRRILIVGWACWLSLIGFLFVGCGSKEQDPAAQGYYEGPMKPKSERGERSTQPAEGL